MVRHHYGPISSSHDDRRSGHRGDGRHNDADGVHFHNRSPGKQKTFVVI